MARSRFHCMLSALIVGGLTGCAMTSDVMDTGNGTYMISGHAAPIRGGATGANQVAYQDAQKFCIQQSPGFHAIVIGAEDRDVYQSSFGGSWGTNGGGFGGGTFAAGNAKLRFRCGPPERSAASN
jgi:hypothetical protein